MNVNDIVYLKSDNLKLIITWVVGKTVNEKNIIDVNAALMMRPDYQNGDIAVKYLAAKEATIPQKCLTDGLTNLVTAINQDLKVGNVVKDLTSEKEMTITWVVGQKIESTNFMNFNELCYSQGSEDGDIVCGFFDKKEYKTDFFKKGAVEKVYE